MRLLRKGRWAAGLLTAFFSCSGISQESCLTCHGPDGNSVTPGIPSIAGQPKLFIETQLVLMREELRPSPAMLPIAARTLARNDRPIASAVAGGAAPQPGRQGRA